MALEFKAVFSVRAAISAHLAEVEPCDDPAAAPPLDPTDSRPYAATGGTGNGVGHPAAEEEGETAAGAAQRFADPVSQRLNIRLVGQEVPHILLYAWDGRNSSGRAASASTPASTVSSPRKSRSLRSQVSLAALRTFIGSYDVEKKEHALLHEHSRTLHVTSATVNRDQTLLAFTTLTQFGGEADGDDEEHAAAEYDSYLVEVRAARPKLFNFNTPRPNYQRVQFLNSTEVNSRASHLLLFRHKENIDLYSVHTGADHQIQDRSLTHEQVSKRFIWFQWDMERQVVYFLYLKTSSDNTEGYETCVKCLKFHNSRFEVKFDVSVPLEHLWAEFADIPMAYLDIPLSHALPFSFFNMEVVHLRKGALCICFQHAPATAQRRPGGGMGDDGGAGPDAVQSDRCVTYTVFVLHYGCALTFSLPLGHLSTAVIARTRLYFTSLNDMLVVYIPGSVVQLVDCGAQHEPSHHLLFTGDAAPLLPGQPEAGDNSCVPLTHFELVKQRSVRKYYGIALFNPETGCAYRMSIKQDHIFELFKDDEVPIAIKLTALHLVIVHLSKQNFVRRVIDYFCSSAPDKLTFRLFKELLIGTTYMNIRQHAKDEERILLTLLPITTVPTYYEELHGEARTEEYKTACAGRLLYSYSEMNREKLRQGTSGKGIDGAYGSLKMQKSQAEVMRFSFDFMHDGMGSVGSAGVTPTRSSASSSSAASVHTTPEPPSQMGSFKRTFSKIFRSPKKEAARPVQAPVEPVSSRVPQLMGDTAAQNEEERMLQTRLLTALEMHFKRFCPPELQGRCADWAREYRNAQYLHATELFRHVMAIRAPNSTQSSANPSDASSTFSSTASETSTPSQLRRNAPISSQLIGQRHSDRVLFRLLERIYCVLQELYFPFPQGFHQQLLVLAEKTLTRDLFVQYVSAGIVRLTPEFVGGMLEELSSQNRPEDVDFKFFLASKLGPKALRPALKRWPHPEVNRYLSEQTAAAMLSNRTYGQLSLEAVFDDQAEMSEAQLAVFPPLQAFMRLLEAQQAEDRREEGEDGRVSLGFVEDSALLSGLSGASMAALLDVSF